MVGEKRLRSAAQQRREMPRHRRHQEHSGLRRRYVFFKAQQGAERCPMNRGLPHCGEPATDIDGVNSEGGPMVAQPCARNELVNGRPSPVKPIARHSGEWVRKRGSSHVGKSPHQPSQ
jgi:hypothetical protein